ncbi:mechanosensitive ion channel family protein [Alteromonas sp. a30]|uniref:mechanosensitive ion channel family protein n=1 Tax=Alteromonas sp. a30 TaxID=2730917 RepID=UPI00227F16C7|nr:mechanosensitive ion channel domain-containing protein [Alteromonas sp. a30]MCY7296458.1 mechanosensitive ion channel [Alteromonas sp. a30]
MQQLEPAWLVDVLNWASNYQASLIWSLVTLLFYLFVTRLALPKIEQKVGQSKLKADAATRAYHTVRLLVATLTVAIVLLVWGIDFSGLLVLSTSLITLTGVALFASWSLLSNITSYFILLFQNSFRRGNFIRIIDVDNYIEGYIAEVNPFNTKLITEDREIVVYPNNLILARPTIINPRQRWSVIGKTTDRMPCPPAPEAPSQTPAQTQQAPQ